MDDIICIGGDEFKEKVVQGILNRFQVGKYKCGTFKYVGIEVDHNCNSIRLSQRQYIDEMLEIDIDSNRTKTDFLNKLETKQLRALTGQILWVSSQTRLDGCYDALELSMERNKGTVETLKRQIKLSEN